MDKEFETIKERELNREVIIQLLKEGKYGVLSMIGENGYGYGIPLNYVLEEDHIYFYYASEGMKMDNLKHDNRVSFCVVGNTRVIPEEFFTEYESVMVFGIVSMDLSEEERLHALHLIVQKYSSDYVELSEKYMVAFFDRTHVLRLDVETMSGKEKSSHFINV